MRFYISRALLVLAVLLFPHEVGAEEGFATSVPAKAWQAGHHWLLATEMFQQAKSSDKGNIPLKYEISVLVMGTELIDGSPCKKLVLIPTKNAPPQMAGRNLFVFIDDRTGWPRRAYESHAGQMRMLHVAGFKDVALIDDMAEGLPVVAFPGVVSREIGPGLKTSSLSLKHVEFDATAHYREAHWTTASNQRVTIRQKWKVGQTWWQECEKYVNGQKEFHAVLTSENIHSKKSEPAQTSGQSTIRTDPRLNVRVSLKRESVSLPEVLQLMQHVSGVKLSLDPKLSNHKPMFKNLHFELTPVWTYMNLMAKHELVDGRHDTKLAEQSRSRQTPFRTLQPFNAFRRLFATEHVDPRQPKKKRPSFLPKKYGHPETSGLRVEVIEAAAVGQYDLKLSR